MINPLKATLGALVALSLSGCGSDYEANPVVCDTRQSNVTLNSPETCTVLTGGFRTDFDNRVIGTDPAFDYVGDQQNRLQGAFWQSGCDNGRRTEISFQQTAYVQTEYAYADPVCSSGATPVSTLQGNFGLSGQIEDPAGYAGVRLQDNNFTDSTDEFYRDIVSVDRNNVLYFGNSRTTGLDINRGFNRSTSSLGGTVTNTTPSL